MAPHHLQTPGFVYTYMQREPRLGRYRPRTRETIVFWVRCWRARFNCHGSVMNPTSYYNINGVDDSKLNASISKVEAESFEILWCTCTLPMKSDISPRRQRFFLPSITKLLSDLALQCSDGTLRSWRCIRALSLCEVLPRKSLLIVIPLALFIVVRTRAD